MTKTPTPNIPETQHPFTQACLEQAKHPWRARKEVPSTSPPFSFFSVTWLESLFRAAPWTPYVLLGPFVAVGIWRTFSSFPKLQGGLYIALGWLIWTLTEYLMHRFGFHFARKSPTLEVMGLIIHGHHHLYPKDTKRLVATPFMHGSLALLFFGIYRLIAGTAWVPLWAGTMLGYLFYEWTHWYAHHGKPRSSLGKRLIRHHLRHHYQDDRAYFGISSPLWDYIFRTHRPPLAETSTTLIHPTQTDLCEGEPTRDPSKSPDTHQDNP
ncbi:MAG: sterol desaturase family protein [Myxococcales bacterium]|nr:sterol desaturase family protein [Myxococcales bacterium]